jgi:signal transduction histidine kinase
MLNYKAGPQWADTSEEPKESWEAAPRSVLESEARTNARLKGAAAFAGCVMYVAKPSLNVISVSESVSDLLGLAGDAVVGRPQFWHERVAAEDWPLFQRKLIELEVSDGVSFMHRITDGFGFPIWLTHSLRRVERGGEISLHGCLVPINGGSRLLALDQDVVARFIHKLGNHFQLLNLAVNTLKKSLADSRESEIIEETLDKAIDLTRVFSDCNQTPSLSSNVPLLEVMKAATESRVSQFAAAGVRLQIDFEGISADATIASDPYLLETALGHILQNALEAIRGNGKVQVGVCLAPDRLRGPARIYVRDTGCGISAREVHQVTLPFFSTKKGHDGLGLTVASRYIELHGGVLRINSREGVGTEVEILLPMERARDDFSV